MALAQFHSFYWSQHGVVPPPATDVGYWNWMGGILRNAARLFVLALPALKGHQ